MIFFIFLYNYFRHIKGFSTKRLFELFPIIEEFIKEKKDIKISRKDPETLELKHSKSIASSDIVEMVNNFFLLKKIEFL